MPRPSIMVFLLCIAAGFAAATPNPYCVSGADWSPGGTMVALGMPADSLGYVWDELYATNLPNMVRPCRYWLLVGGGHRPHGYHEDTDTIDAPATFGAWVTTHPGKIWIIGNEPNLTGQDGLTPEQYARMFKTYHDFIRARDPSSVFAVGALAADTEPGWVTNDANWWNQALQAYKNNNGGVAMPVDIWNSHGYSEVGHLNADRVVSEFFTPFRQWVNTVDGGRYAGCELWCTEFGVALWGQQLSAQHIGEFMAQLCPRLERAGISRFFWFLGPWDTWSGDLYQPTCLVGPTGTRTALGDTYYNLAQTYAQTGSNPIPPPPPARGTPPERFADSFDSAPAAEWDVQAGEWSVVSGEYRQTRTAGAFWGVSSRLPFEYQDVHVHARLRIISALNASNWAGLSLRGSGIWDGADTTGYLVYLRQNGAVGFYIAAENRTVVEVPEVVADTSVFHSVHVRLVGSRMTVDVDGRLVLDATDANNRRVSGDVGLITGQVQAAFDDVMVARYVAGDFDQDGDVDQTDFGYFQACFSGSGVAQDDFACFEARMDDDADVDSADFQKFLNCMSGPVGSP